MVKGRDQMSASRKLVRVSARTASALVVALGLGGFAWGVSSSRVHAQAPAADPEDIAEGMTIFRTKADCQTCHGWAADGRKMDTQMPDAPNLRTSRLGRAGIIYAIKCGRPGRGMPAFDRQAYKDPSRCMNLTEADLKKNNQELVDPASTLQPREIEMVADFLFAKVIGKGPMDHAKCVEYWGSEQEVCDSEFPK
jgi:mono/diheme cytochrome c family protein